MPWSTSLLALVFVALTLRDTSRARLAYGEIPRRAAARAVVAAVGGPTHALRGRVTTPDGRALGGASLEAILVLQGRTYPIAEALSDDDGRFALPDLPEGSYWVLARAPGRARRVDTVRVGHIAPAELALVLASGATIAGSVARTNGRDAPLQPLANVVIRASPDGGGEGPPFGARTDASGAFVLEGLPAGSYRVEVAEPGYEPVVRRAVPAPVRGLALALRALATVRGVVREASGLPASSADVVIAGSGIWPPRSTHVRPNGEFEITSIPSGVYELRAGEGDEVAEPVAPLVLDPGDAREVQLTVTPGATLIGTVVDAVTLRPIGGARVIVAEDALSTSPHALTADASGNFVVHGLLHRPHQVSARAPGYVPRVGTLAVPDTTPVTVPLDRQVALTGRVVDSHGAPIAGAQIEVQVRDLDGRVSWLTASAISFRDALFAAQSHGPRPLVPAGELGVMPGPIPVIPLAQQNATPSSVFTGDAARAGYVTDADGRFHVDEVPPGVVSVAATHPAYVRGESTQRVARAGEALDLEIVLHAGGTIDGRLVDDRGFPVPGQPIEVRETDDPVPRRAFTLRDGTFRVPSVLGHVAVVALIGGRVGARAEVDVADDAIVPVELVLDRGVRRVRGRVLDPRGFPVVAADLAIAAEHGPAAIHTLSSADGTFDTVITGDGVVQIDARHPSFAPRSMHVASVESDVTVTLEEGSTAVVRVAGADCATSEIAVELRTPCGPYRRNLHGAGEWRVEHICAGHVTAIASAVGCVRVERGGTVSGTDPVEIPALDLAAGGAAIGEVVDAHGDPVPGAAVLPNDAPLDSTTGVARTGRRGEFTITDLPDGDQTLVAIHPILGRSRTDSVRIARGTIARGVRLVFEHDLAGATADARAIAVQFADRAGHVEVRFVAPDSAAARAGLQPGDEVLAVEGHRVDTAVEAATAIAGPAGDEIAVDVTRDGVRRTVRWLREPEP